jgi:RNA polymerase sigma-70 factor (ECF subfamily)
MQPPEFASTRWSLVLAAGKREPEARAALEALCTAYWYPVYGYVRRRVGRPEDAQELTQAFFASLLERNALALADPDRGRFRAFLLTACKNFLNNEWDKQRAQKRGGGRGTLSLDFAQGEERLRLEPADHDTPERWYERQWALALLDRVLGLLREEFSSEGRAGQFDRLKNYLGGQEPATPYSELAAHLGVSEGAARVIVHRLRRRYRELLRAEIAETVAGEEEIDDEIHRLFAALAS